MKTKVCTGDCGRELPATTEFFHKNKCGGFGLRGECRECNNKRQKERNNPPNTDASIKQVCTGICGRELPATTEFFHRFKGGKFGVQAECKECVNKKKKEINKPANTNDSIKQTCSICDKEFSATLEYFYRSKTGKFGVKRECKECKSKRQKEINKPPNEDINIKQTCTGCDKELPATLEHFNKDKKGKFGVGGQCKVCQIKKSKQWRKDNKDKVNEYQKNKYHTNEQYRIRSLLRSNLWKALNNIGHSKNASILDYIGCDMEFLKKHLNSTKDDNWGDVELDIDHIIPQSLYDFTNEEEIKKVYNWRNLRYLPKPDNSSKGDTLFMELVEEYDIYDLLPDF